MKVLQIDDSTEICRLYSDMFEVDNHTFESVDNGRKGLKLVTTKDYDLILLDVYMPNYSGMDFLRDLKKQRPSELRKVVVTSILQFNESQEKELKKLGVHAIEEKPKNLQQLERIQKDMWLR